MICAWCQNLIYKPEEAIRVPDGLENHICCSDSCAEAMILHIHEV
jgi:hypothetical protein